jgi:hypothetical protein
MFFHVSKTTQDNFPHNHQTKNFVISLDQGWTHVQDFQGNDIWYKGYIDDAPLRWYAVRVSAEQQPQQTGNFCVIKVTDQQVVIRSDKLRSFPLWYNSEQGLTNLRNIGETIWSDCLVTLNNDMTLTRDYFDAVGTLSDVKLSFDTVVDQVDEIIKRKVIEFLEYRELPIKVFLSGGVDTALVFSYLKKYTDDYELVLNSHVDYDYFYLKNHGYLSELWGYTQIHHWETAGYLTSGAPGDEFTARSPVTANFLLLAQGTSIPKLLNDTKYVGCLHYNYFNQTKYLDAWAKQEQEYVSDKPSWIDTLKLCCNYNINDWQHWHLGRTLTWTPLRELEIFKLIASLPIEDLCDQVMTSSVQLALIKRNSPEVLEYISKQKNSMNYMENLSGLLR